MLVHVVGRDDDVGMSCEHRAECHQLGARVGRTGRIAGAVEDQEPRARRDRGGELRRRDLETLLRARKYRNRRAVGEQHHVRVGHPVRRRDDHLVARVEQGAAEVEDRLLGAARDQDLVALVLEAIVAAELADDRVLQLVRAVDIRVTREAAADRRDAGLGDVRRRVEIRLAGTEADDVLALGLEACRARGDGERGRGLDALDARWRGGWSRGSTVWPETRLRYGKAFCVAMRNCSERSEAI